MSRFRDHAGSDELRAALDYLRQGASVIPIHTVIRQPGGSFRCSCSKGFACRDPGKHPAMPAWKRYQTERADEGTLRAWFGGPQPRNVGIVTGAVSGNIFVVDVDVGGGKLGQETWDALQVANDDVPHTVEARTGSGGRHLLFRERPGVIIKTGANVLGSGVDVRGEGGYVVASPSQHVSGRRYEWREGCQPSDVLVADAPAWLLDRVGHDAVPIAGTVSVSAPAPIERDASGLITDGREGYMLRMASASIINLMKLHGRPTTPEEVFADAWPIYEARVGVQVAGKTLEQEGRGPTAMRSKIAAQLRACASGAWDEGHAVLQQARLQHDPHTAQPVRPHRLPPYYPACAEPRDEALERQRELISTRIRDGALRAGVRREVRRRAKEAIAADESLTGKQKRAVRRRIRRKVMRERRLLKLPCVRIALITGSQGTGKTRLSIEEIAEIKGDVVICDTQPSLAKAEEVARDYRVVATANSMPALVCRGRGAPDPEADDNARMCRRHEVVNRAARKGINIRKAICQTCPFAGECGYLRQEAAIQAMGERGLFLQAREYLFFPSPAPAPDILIADEAVTITAIADVVEFSPHELQDVVSYFGGSDLANVIRANETINKLADALKQSEPLKALRDANVTIKDLSFACRMLESAGDARRPEIDGRMSDDDIDKALASIKGSEIANALMTVDAVIREMKTGRDTLTAVVYDPRRKVKVNGREERLPRLRVHRLHGLRGVNGGTTVLLLDGTGSPDLNRALFGVDLEHHHIPIERDAYVTGTKGKSYSRQSITGCDSYGKPIPNKMAAAARLRVEIAGVATDEAKAGPALLAATLRAIEAIVEMQMLPDTVRTGHFGAVRGINAWEDCVTSVCVGREGVSIEQLEDMTRAYMAEDPEPFVSFDKAPPEEWPWQTWPYRASRGRRMRDGSVQPIEVEVHPDPRCQEVLEQIREAEAVQTADRTRPIFNRRSLILANDLCLDVTYDRILTHAELVAGGTRWERAWQANGVLPLGAADLHQVHHGLFPTEEAARNALKKDPPKWGPTPNRYSIWAETPFTYRRVGQPGRVSRILVDVQRHPDPRAAVEMVLGPLAMFNAEPTASASHAAKAPMTPLDQLAQQPSAGVRLWLQSTEVVPHIRMLLEREGTGRGRVVLIPRLESARDIEIVIPGGFNVTPRLAQALKALPDVERVDDIRQLQ